MSLLSLELSKKPHDFEKDGADLRPLSLPDTVRVELGALHDADLESAVVDLSAELAPGRFQVPISGGVPMQLEVREGCRLAAHTRLTRADGLGPVISEISGAFGPPVELHNILATLGEVRTLFRDRTLGRVLDAAELSKWASRWLSENVELPAAFLRALEGRLDSVACIELASFRATLSRKKGQPPELSFRFDGHVRLAGSVRVPFRGIRLPTFILPALHARLEDLLGANPLASGDLLDQRLPMEGFLRAVLPLARSVEASLRANGTLPEVQLRTDTFNRSRLEARVSVPGKARLLATVKGHSAGGRMSLEARGAELTLGERRLGADVRLDAALDDLVELAMSLPARGQKLEAELWPEREPPRRAIVASVTLLEGSTLSTVETHLKVEHPLAAGTTALSGTLDELGVGGTCELAIDPCRRSISPLSIALDFSGRLEAREGGRLDVGGTRLSAESFASRLSGSARLIGAGKPLVIELDSQTDLKAVAEQQLPPVPELSMPEGKLKVGVDGRLSLAGKITFSGPEGRPGLDFEGSRFDLSLARCEADLDGLRLSLPAGSRIDARVTRGYLNSTGLGELELGLGWDLRGESAVLESATRRAVLFVEELRRMQVSVGVSPSGLLSFSGGRENSLYDAGYLNAIVDPIAHPEKWLDIVSDDAAMDRVFETLGVVSTDIEKLARQGRDVALRVRDVLKKERVEEPGDFLPRERMSRVLSLALGGDLRLKDRLAEIIRKVTDAEGLDRHAVEQLVCELWPDHGYAFELDRLLRWADHMLSPAEPLPPPTVVEQKPLVERQSGQLQGVPSAAQLYQALSRPGRLDLALCDQVVRLAPWLTREQLSWIDETCGGRLPDSYLRRLQFVRELKHRVDLVARGFGGIGYAPQAMAIAFFLADVLDASDAYFRPLGARPLQGGPLPCDGVLGPEDVATLLAAGTANVTPSRTAQLNQRMLFDYLLARPPAFLVGVLAEMGKRSPRVLTHVLSSLLNQDQSHLRSPLDVPATLGKLLGMDLPRRSEYMAGGRWAKESYYGALMRTAEFVLDQAEPYLACRDHLQVQRLPVAVPPAARKAAPKDGPEAAARKAIAQADKLAARCRFDGAEASGPVAQAREAYEQAFAACRELLAADRLAFHKDWFKKFWKRNHEALVVRSVVRNYQDDVDRVRFWLHVRRGSDRFGEGEQRLVEMVIDSLYFFEEDREILRGDPLVRLLLDPPKGRYDFTVVTGMGVITEGRAGRELEDAFHRLEAERGVKLVRADTGTAKPLEHNARKVIEAIEQVRTPYGLIGYSQGCANVLMAEAMLLGGTPSRRALLDRLVCRNFLFSAINGSAHGSCGNEKLLRAMVEGELFLKHYQAVFSSSIIENFNRALDSALNLPMLSVILGSVDSLSHEGVVALARDGQFLPHVPSSTVRGAVVEETVPEALEMLSHVITRQVRGALHDTQVTLVSAVGHPNRVATPAARVLECCDMGSLAQSCHHWSPLLHETAFVTTERDRARAIYDYPKDRHLFPWIEVNARFGTIAVSRGRVASTSTSTSTSASTSQEAKKKPARTKAPARRRKAS
ncbi:MAG TPA: hypothetical protein VGK67_04140 [Myxococcales bacterium]